MAGFEPTNTVSQNASTGAAMFGSPMPDQRLDYLKLNQDQQQFNQGVGLQRDNMQLQRETRVAGEAENQRDRQHQVKMEETKTKNQNDLAQRAFNANKNLQVVELKFAQANAAERERIAPLVMEARKRAAEADAKLASFTTVMKAGREGIKTFMDQATKMRDDLKASQEQARVVGKRVAMDAVSRIAEDLSTAGADGYKIWQQIANGVLLPTSDPGESDYGFDLLKINDDLVNARVGEGDQGEYSGIGGFLKSAGEMVGQTIENLSGDTLQLGPDAKNQAIIDDQKIQQRASELVSKYIARSLSQQTGDKFAPEDVRSLIEEMFKGGNEPGNITDMLMKMQTMGISTDVLRSAFLETSAALDGMDKDGPEFNRVRINEKRNTLPTDSAQYMALEATLKLMDRMQSMARTASVHLKSVDLDSFDKMITYMNRVASGGSPMKRNDLAGLVPSLVGTADDDLRSSIMLSGDLGGLESLPGSDPFGYLNREIGLLGKSKSDIESEIAGYGMELSGLDTETKGRSKDLGKMLRDLERLVY